MIYGHYTEGRRRECANCSHITSVFTYCWTCEMTICDGCEHTCALAAELQEVE